MWGRDSRMPVHRLAQRGQRIWPRGVPRLVQSSWKEEREEAMRKAGTSRQKALWVVLKSLEFILEE